MFNNHYYAIIMAGGLGTRFWPISRKALPKQFLDFTHSGKSFLRRTYDRVAAVVPQDHIIVVTLKEYKDIVLEQIPGIPEENILMELYNRNTAPCITFATLEVLKRDPHAVCVVTPSDHMVSDTETFAATLREAFVYASSNDYLITLGVVPTRPDSNFGYIQMSGGAASVHSTQPVKVKTFTEKPDRGLAKVFVDSGEFLWNSGIFVWKASVIREELDRYAPFITSLWKESDDIDRIYTDCLRISIDYAVMEKTERAVVIPARFDWADIGNWDSLCEHMESRDAEGNANNVSGKHLFKDTSGSIVYSSGKDKLIAVKGVKDMLVIDTDDVLMIAPRDDDNLKDFLSELAMPEFEEYR